MAARSVNLKFEMFLDRPGVMARVDAWKLRILARTGGYGRTAMRRLFKPPLRARKQRNIFYGGHEYGVPLKGLVRHVATGRPVTADFAKKLRILYSRRNRFSGKGVGQPPRRGPTDLLRKLTIFEMDRQHESVVIGPMPFDEQPPLVGAVSVPELLDKGGYEQIGKELVKYEPRPFVERTLPPTLRFLEKTIEKQPVDNRRGFSVGDYF